MVQNIIWNHFAQKSWKSILGQMRITPVFTMLYYILTENNIWKTLRNVHDANANDECF